MLQNWYNQKQEGSTWLYQKTFQRTYKALQRKTKSTYRLSNMVEAML